MGYLFGLSDFAKILPELEQNPDKAEEIMKRKATTVAIADKIREEIKWGKVIDAHETPCGTISILIENETDIVFKSDIKNLEDIANSFGYFIRDFSIYITGKAPIYVSLTLCKKR